MAYAAVVAVVEDDVGRFLVVRHRARGWELPGGKPEGGESPTDTARREVLEETGHVVRRVRHVGDLSPRVAVVTAEAAAAAPAAASDPAVVEWRFVHRLSEVAPLSFPDDPVDVLARIVGRELA